MGARGVKGVAPVSGEGSLLRQPLTDPGAGGGPLTGVPPDSFGIDLAGDRVLASVEEYAVGRTALLRWQPARV